MLLARLEEHLMQREWVQLDREAQRLKMMESLSPRDEGRVLRAWGRAKAGLNKYHAAARLLEQARVLSFGEKDWECLGYIRAELGALSTTLGDLDAGMRNLQTYLLDYSKYEGARDLLGKVQFNLALTYKYRRQYDLAIAHYKDAVNWFTLRGFSHEKAMAHQNMAWLYCTIDQPGEALAQLQVADTYREMLSSAFDAEQICCWAFYYLTVSKVGAAVDCVQEILLGNRQGVDAHHIGQAAVIGTHVAIMLDQEPLANLLLDLAINAALDAQDPPVANDCSRLRALIWGKWRGTQEAAQ